MRQSRYFLASSRAEKYLVSIVPEESSEREEDTIGIQDAVGMAVVVLVVPVLTRVTEVMVGALHLLS